MTFAAFLPPQAEKTPVPVIWYLSGLTCTHQNVMDKGEYRRVASDLGVAIICPDTSPRGDHVPDDKNDWKFGSARAFRGYYLGLEESDNGPKKADAQIERSGANNS